MRAVSTESPLIYCSCCDELIELEQDYKRAKCSCGESGGACVIGDCWVWGDAVAVEFDKTLGEFAQRSIDGEAPFLAPLLNNPSFRANCWVLTEKSEDSMIRRFISEEALDDAARECGIEDATSKINGTES